MKTLSNENRDCEVLLSLASTRTFAPQGIEILDAPMYNLTLYRGRNPQEAIKEAVSILE